MYTINMSRDKAKHTRLVSNSIVNESLPLDSPIEMMQQGTSGTIMSFWQPSQNLLERQESLFTLGHFYHKATTHKIPQVSF